MRTPPQNSTARTLVVRDLEEHRAHVLRTIDGLGERDLDCVVARSGWTPRSMVSHLLHDVEIFWLRAVLGADESAIDRLRDGWTAPPLPGPELRAAYRRETALGDGESSPARIWRPRPCGGRRPRCSTHHGSRRAGRSCCACWARPPSMPDTSTWRGRRSTAGRTWWSARPPPHGPTAGPARPLSRRLSIPSRGSRASSSGNSISSISAMAKSSIEIEDRPCSSMTRAAAAVR